MMFKAHEKGEIFDLKKALNVEFGAKDIAEYISVMYED